MGASLPTLPSTVKGRKTHDSYNIHEFKVASSTFSVSLEVLKTAGNIVFMPKTLQKWVDISRAWKENIFVQIEHGNIKCHIGDNLLVVQKLGPLYNKKRKEFQQAGNTSSYLWHYRGHIAVTPLANGKD